jgi:hypothetical protein
MVVDEQRLRQSLHARLAELVGADETALLMNYLPPVGWADVATKRDLEVVATGLRPELAVLRSDLRSGISELRGEIGAVRGELGGAIDGLRGDLRAEFKGQTTRLLFWLVPTVIGGMGLASRLG